MPRIRLFGYRLAPHSRRTRVILIGDEIFTKVGGYVLGNFLTSVIAGIGTHIWLLISGVPYPILLAPAAIPAAAVIRLFLQEMVFRRLDAS